MMTEPEDELTVYSGVLLDACQANGKSSACQESYEQCLGAGQTTTSKVHCVSEVEALIQSGSSGQDAQVANAQCKQVMPSPLLLNLANR
jgi:uncharacterized protein YgiB involved in biofilm formation